MLKDLYKDIYRQFKEGNTDGAFITHYFVTTIILSIIIFLLFIFYVIMDRIIYLIEYYPTACTITGIIIYLTIMILPLILIKPSKKKKEDNCSKH